MSATIRSALLIAALVPLAACTGPRSAVDALPEDASARTEALAELKDDLSNSVSPIPAAPPAVQFTGMGLSQVSTQPGASTNEKRLMAIRAARMDALRDLTEQIHGIQIDAQTLLRDQVIQSDTVRGLIAGEIRGARTLRITPKGDDSYQVVLALDPDTVAYIVRAARKG